MPAKVTLPRAYRVRALQCIACANAGKEEHP